MFARAVCFDKMYAYPFILTLFERLQKTGLSGSFGLLNIHCLFWTSSAKNLEKGAIFFLTLASSKAAI